VGEGEQVVPHRAAAASIDCPGAGRVFAFRQQHCHYIIGVFGSVLCHSLCPSCGSAERKIRSARSSSLVVKCAMLLDRWEQMLRQTTMSILSCCLGDIICVLPCYAPRDSLHGFRACDPSNPLGAPRGVALSSRFLEPSRHRTPANIGSGCDRPAGARPATTGA
jgi:hypothetical protein